jgi:HAMP domain-containing protein
LIGAYVIVLDIAGILGAAAALVTAVTALRRVRILERRTRRLEAAPPLSGGRTPAA